ncbi:MAG: MerR family transcriptional regulator [Thermoleophilaceae bacterium]
MAHLLVWTTERGLRFTFKGTSSQVQDALLIGELAQRAGLATPAIRYYESIGLLPEPYRVSGQRRYGDDTLKRLEFIAAAQHAGFTLREITELSDGFDVRGLAQRKAARGQGGDQAGARSQALA